MNRVSSFSAISSPSARVLILGSMPGKRSLEMQQYYAHPQNAFWRIMAQLLDFDAALPYELRLECISKSDVALWDVMAACERPSSLDSDIVEASIIANDFSAFFSEHPHVAHVFCNGVKSFQSYQRHVCPMLDKEHAEIPVTRLPSTSPAHASMSFQAKLEAWRSVQAFCQLEEPVK